MYLIPAPGRAIPDPARHDILPPEGREVWINQYWMRRIADGDVTEGQPPADPPPPKVVPTPTNSPA